MSQQRAIFMIEIIQSLLAEDEIPVSLRDITSVIAFEIDHKYKSEIISLYEEYIKQWNV